MTSTLKAIDKQLLKDEKSFKSCSTILFRLKEKKYKDFDTEDFEIFTRINNEMNILNKKITILNTAKISIEKYLIAEVN